MSRFAGIAAAMERAAYESTAEEIKKFKLDLYLSTWQIIREAIASLLPKTRTMKKAARESTEKILSVIREYRPLLEEQYRLYHHFFWMWEDCNCEGGYQYQGEASRGESKALEEIKRLTGEFQKELDAIGWKYKPIPGTRELISGYVGSTYIDKALKYFELLEKHFDERR